MSVQNATLFESATISAAGGTSKSYSPDGLRVNNGVHIIDTSVTDARTRPSITAKSKPAVIGSDGKWSNDQRELVITRPKILAIGEQKFPNIRIILTTHPENTAAEIEMLKNLGSQSLFDPDFTVFWNYGSLA